MGCEKQQAIKLIRNFPTRFDSVDWLSVSFDSVISLVGFKMKFILGTVAREFTDLSQSSIINLTKAETSLLSVGLNSATIIVTDTENNSRPFTTSIPILVSDWVDGEYQEIETYNSTVNVTLDNTTQFTIKIDGAVVDPTIIDEKIAAHNTSTTAHSDIRTLITNEATTRANADNTLAESINTEASTRAAADTTLTNNLNTEIATRENADTVLATSISTEATTRANADANLQTQINGKQDALGYTPENIANKVVSISSSSTDTQYPSAKCMWTIVGNVESALLALRGNV